MATPDNPWVKPAGLALLTLIAVAVAVVAILNTPSRQGEDAPTSGGDLTVGPTTAPEQETPTTVDGSPHTSMEAIPGCDDPSEGTVDELVDLLDADDVTVELSATWSGKTDDGGRQEMAALMVRSKDGTIDQPHLVFERREGEWVAVTRLTAEASSAPDQSAERGFTQGVDNAVHCLTAGSR